MVSIVIPTLNETNNILPLVKRIDKATQKKGMLYEIIFVDDHSTDDTQDKISQLRKKFPVKLHVKQGARGKAQSLLEGFALASFDIICMIDADLQYPPEAIPQMVKKITDNKADIVVANRKQHKTSFVRKVFSGGFRTVFGKMLHGLDCDVQSGLKVFDKDILNRFTIAPGPWTFDLEFLTKAQTAGYRIDQYDITFSPRYSGQAKVNLFVFSFCNWMERGQSKAFTPGTHALYSKARGEQGRGFHYNGKKYVTHTPLDYRSTALKRLSDWQKLALVLIVMTFGWSLWSNWLVTLQWTLEF